MNSTNENTTTPPANCGNTVLAAGIYKPILFSTEMVKSIIAGRKTQTRRIIKNKDILDMISQGFLDNAMMLGKNRPGHIFWVRETWQHTAILNLHPSDENFGFVYKADGQPWEDFEGWNWKPSIFMPKSACRIFLKINRIRIERLQDITEEDSIAEGIEDVRHKHNYDFQIFKDYNGIMDGFQHPPYSFRSLWQSINGDKSWNQNPWVFVYEFQRTHASYA